jgi:PAS domain S-box-containing protein
MTDHEGTGADGRAHDRSLYRTLIEDSNDVATVIDTDGTITYVSPAVTRVLGYDPDELVGQTGYEFVHPDDQERNADAVEAVLQTPDESRTVEVRFGHADGSWCWIESTLRNRLDDDVVDGILVNSRDITKRKERKQELRELAEEYRAMFENADDAIFLVDVDTTDGVEFRFRRLSPAYEEQTGILTENVRGKTPREVFGEADGAELAANYHRCLKRREPVSYEEELVVADDAKVWQTSLAPVIINGEVTRIVGIARNVTDRVERERELKQQNERLDEFASVISHDLRNPLNVAQGRTALLAEGTESEHLDVIERALDRMEAIVEDTLTLARQGDTVSDRNRIRMTDLLGQCWKMVDAGDATLELDDEFAVEGDRDRLRHVFENLFRNAVEHGGEGVTVRVGRTDDDGFYVEDDGVGVPADARAAVFEPGHSSASDGTGFGLTIVKRIVEAHEWNLRVTGGRDGGARFEVTGVDSVS